MEVHPDHAQARGVLRNSLKLALVAGAVGGLLAWFGDRPSSSEVLRAALFGIGWALCQVLRWRSRVPFVQGIWTFLALTLPLLPVVPITAGNKSTLAGVMACVLIGTGCLLLGLSRRQIERFARISAAPPEPVSAPAAAGS